ncbi:MAG: HPr family phosphocarrier protein [Lentisphaerae bacterium]|jgi:phosphocarrier protein HPr|nr:HPr family phosphocarrier protein [Lentisphaerota bacterium]MBT5605383.1 HPr family phosphocarrier protein [Lentisphaerota bacterium]MBT7060388.1 HPr family phosphocarrier protein [Lentisphaerota bacterium]MBT7844758.1 HPr family phosphocarrier protein [Lentisphaerota bacterium]
MITKQATVQNEYGIHCRPSAVIVKEAMTYSADILAGAPGAQPVDAKSILAIVGLGLACGRSVELTVSGDDEEATCDRMVELFETRFDFPQEK